MTSLDHSTSTFAMRIHGDSMEKTFLDGDLVLIDPGVAPRPGDFVVAQNSSGEATFKKYRVMGLDDAGRDVFELTPLNRDYPTWRSDQQELRVVGVMMEHRIPRRR